MWTKLILYITVFFTAFSGVWWDQSVPYFPIEISRTATGPISRFLFPCGTLIAFVASWYEYNTIKWPFVGLFLLAAVDDKTSWIIHMLGVFMMACSIGWDAWQSKKGWYFLLVACIYLGRLVLKMGVTYHHGLFQGSIAAAKNIMYTGKAESEAQLLIFKLCGLLQWVVLYGFLELL